MDSLTNKIKKNVGLRVPTGWSFSVSAFSRSFWGTILENSPRQGRPTIPKNQIKIRSVNLLWNSLFSFKVFKVRHSLTKQNPSVSFIINFCTKKESLPKPGRSVRVSPPSYLKGNSERLVQFNVKNLEGKGINKHVDKGSPKLDKEVQSAKPPITAECKNNQHPHGLEKVPLTLTVSFLIFFSDACVIFFCCKQSVVVVSIDKKKLFSLLLRPSVNVYFS